MPGICVCRLGVEKHRLEDSTVSLPRLTPKQVTSSSPRSVFPHLGFSATFTLLLTPSIPLVNREQCVDRFHPPTVCPSTSVPHAWVPCPQNTHSPWAPLCQAHGPLWLEGDSSGQSQVPSELSAPTLLTRSFFSGFPVSCHLPGRGSQD